MNDIPLCEYPRPQLARESYSSLNGVWKVSITKDITDNRKVRTSGKIIYRGDITVPFSPESKKSGVGHILLPDEVLTYRRAFDIEEAFLNDIVLLHFDAVDYGCDVFLNDRFQTRHKGGYIPFTADITKDLKIGINTITVAVYDPTDTKGQARGKQKLKRGGIFYTPTSGIWGSVWLESVSYDYIKSIKIDTDIDSETVTIKAVADAQTYRVKVFEKDMEVIEALSDESKMVKINIKNPRYWSPEDPFLYDVEIKTENDSVRSYFGMRKFSFTTDDKGYKRITLNNDIYFHNGVLDQGYHMESLLTPLSDEQMINDIRTLKNLGFNMIRKHIKIEPLRWYYHCDRIGMLVWQDMVNGGGKYDPMTVAVKPFIGMKMDDTRYNAFSRSDKAYREEFIEDMNKTVDHLYNCVSICEWTLFNEGWGQFDSKKLTVMLKALDSTRYVDSTSGWHEQADDLSDFQSRHIYFMNIKFSNDKIYKDKAAALTEFGGLGMKIKGHMYDEFKTFGYKNFNDRNKMQDAYDRLYKKSVIKDIQKGLCVSVYTQITDVEEEINGLMTYDRQVMKFDPARIKAVNDIINKINIDARRTWRKQ